MLMFKLRIAQAEGASLCFLSLHLCDLHLVISADAIVYCNCAPIGFQRSNSGHIRKHLVPLPRGTGL